jgi:hypothetical protein
MVHRAPTVRKVLPAFLAMTLRLLWEEQGLEN